jgi:hypothetical protein
MIWEAYNKDSVFSLEQFRATYPEDLSPVIHEEEARIEAKHIIPTDESIEEGAREQHVLEALESPSAPDTRPEWEKEIQNAKARLWEGIKNGTSEQVGYMIREHIRLMEGLWDTMTDSEKLEYGNWYTMNIQGKGLGASLLDIISSPEARKIPITYFGCPKCREDHENFHASSPKSFQDHCKRLHNCTYQEARDPTVFIMNQVTHNEIEMRAFWGSGEQRLMRFLMPMCYMPNCPHHAILPGTSFSKHMTDFHLTEIADKLGFLYLILAHIRAFPLRKATVEDLLGKHAIHVCTGEQCGFGSVTKIGVKRHLVTHKGRASEIPAELRPVINPGAKGDCSEEKKRTNEDPETLGDERETMSVAERNVLGHFWLSKFREWHQYEASNEDGS